MNRKNIEFWVGAFIFIGLFILAYMTIRFGSYDRYRKSYEFSVSFQYTNGVVKGAPVRVAGVEVGRVKKLVLTPDDKRKVDVIVLIDQSVQLRKNVKAVINSLGIMGEKYIEFLPQGPDAEVIQPGDGIQGINPISIADLTSQAQELVTSVQDIFHDSKAGNKLSLIIDNLVAITGTSNQENISVALRNMRQFSENINAFGEDLEEVSKNKNFSETVTNFHTASVSLKNVLEKIQSGEGTVGQLIYKDDLHDKLKAFLKELMDNPSKLLRPTQDKKRGKGSLLFFNKNEN